MEKRGVKLSPLLRVSVSPFRALGQDLTRRGLETSRVHYGFFCHFHHVYSPWIRVLSHFWVSHEMLLVETHCGEWLPLAQACRTAGKPWLGGYLRLHYFHFMKDCVKVRTSVCELLLDCDLRFILITPRPSPARYHSSLFLTFLLHLLLLQLWLLFSLVSSLCK